MGKGVDKPSGCHKPVTLCSFETKGTNKCSFFVEKNKEVLFLTTMLRSSRTVTKLNACSHLFLWPTVYSKRRSVLLGVRSHHEPRYSYCATTEDTANTVLKVQTIHKNKQRQ